MSKIKEYGEMVTSLWGSGPTFKFEVLADATRKAIMVLLSLKGPMTNKQMADELDLSPSTISAHIEKLSKGGVVKEIEVPNKVYKRERYYDIDIIPYFEDEEKEIDKRIGRYTDILKETAKAVYEKCLNYRSDYFNETLMFKHKMTLERDDVKNFVWTKISRIMQSYFSRKGIYKQSFETEKKWFCYIGMKKD
jgi:DNA-binding transcriptional ArsR family regulator